MTVLTWAGIAGAVQIFAAFFLLCRQVEQLTHHVNRLIEAEDKRAKGLTIRGTLTLSESRLRDVVRRELRSFAEDQLREHQARQQ